MHGRPIFFAANRSLYIKSPTRFLSECVLQFFHRQCSTARFDLLWNNAIYGSLFTEVCLLYIRANVPTMGPVVSTSRSQLSVIVSRKTRRRNFCKWSHSLSTAGLSAEWRAKRYATFTRQSEFIKSDDPAIHSPERERLKIQSV